MRDGALWPIYSGAIGSVGVLTQYNYCGDHSYCDRWVTRTTQFNGCTGLVPEVLCMFRHQLCIERDIIAAFLLHQGYPLVQGLIVVMTLLVTIVVVILMLWAFKDGGNQS